MKVFHTISEFREWRQECGGTVGFVPTMGALHSGHQSLMEASVAESESTVLSIFVNPLQFAPTEDLSKYPRTLDADLHMAHGAGVSAVFAPEPSEMTSHQNVNVSVRGVADPFEGKRRPTHFDGVATIVTKLFHIVEPTTAYFGLKDLQQCAVVSELIRSLNMNIQLRLCEIVREESGLALSSRNNYLSHSQRLEASEIFMELTKLRNILVSAGGVRDNLLNECRTALVNKGFDVEYLAVVDPYTMLQTSAIEGSRIIIAAKFHGVRLIDNLAVG